MASSNKAQAALEFLTTYGWAFLVILIMIGTLAYFGILNPSNILPNRCNFGTELGCEDYTMTTSGITNNVRLRLKNNAGQAITVQGINIGTEGIASLSCGIGPASPTLPYAGWRSGEAVEFVWNCPANELPNKGLVAGDKGKINVTVNYYDTSSGVNYVRVVKGEIYTTIR